LLPLNSVPLIPIEQATAVQSHASCCPANISKGKYVNSSLGIFAANHKIPMVTDSHIFTK